MSKYPGYEVPGLKAVRGELGLSQREFAFLAGCDRTTVCNVEAGRQRVSRKMAVEMIAAVRTLKERQAKLRVTA